MGLFASTPQKEMKVLIVGLDAAGRTTMLYHWWANEKQQYVIPTVGINCETFTHKDASVTVWDVGANAQSRFFYANYFKPGFSLIWVVDCTDRERIEESHQELLALIKRIKEKENPEEIPLLIFVNKRDKAGGLTGDEVTDIFHLKDIEDNTIVWHVQESSAETGEGLTEGLDFLYDHAFGNINS